MAERAERPVCPGCGKSFRALGGHLAHHLTCPTALEYQAKAENLRASLAGELDGDGAVDALFQIPEPPTESETPAGDTLRGPPLPPPLPAAPAGMTEAEVRALMTEGIAAAIAQVSEAVNARLETERQATKEQLAQVGPAVLAYLREVAAKEQAGAQAPTQQATPSNGEQPRQGGGMGELISLFQTFQKPSGGGMEQIAETIGSIGKLADALDSLRYRPWRDGVDFATNNILQRTRMGDDSKEAAKALQDNPPNWAARPTPPQPLETK